MVLVSVSAISAKDATRAFTFLKIEVLESTPEAGVFDSSTSCIGVPKALEVRPARATATVPSLTTADSFLMVKRMPLVSQVFS